MPPLEQNGPSDLNGRNRLRRSDLARLFPAVFGEEIWRPLKIGIDQDILDVLGQQVHAGSVRLCLRRHTGRPDYLRALVAGGPRFCLDGLPDGEVSAKDQAAAAKALESLLQRCREANQRALFLKAFEVVGLSMQAYAAREGIDERKVQSDVDRALNERRVKHEKRAILAKQFEISGMSADEYAGKRGISVKKLQSILAEIAGQPSTHCATSPNAGDCDG